MPHLSIISYNINGIRSGIQKGLSDWLSENPIDLVCLQELKALPSQIPVELLESAGYKCYWHSSEKKGYSGVGILSKFEPDNIIAGCGNQEFDKEGRVLRMDWGDLTLLNIYFPSGSSGDIRQSVKMDFLDFIYDYIENLKLTRPKLLVAGDYNICHKPIDIHDPIGNKKSSGFLPEEREWMDKYFGSGQIDTFRHFNQNPHQYTWWSFRANARNNNKGWRIDYISATENLKGNLIESKILTNVMHSDHCPVLLRLIN